MECQKTQDELDEARKAMEELHAFYKDVSIRWASKLLASTSITAQSSVYPSGPTPKLIGGERITWPNMILVHVILSPPIDFGVGPEGYTEDWAVIEIDASNLLALEIGCVNLEDRRNQFQGQRDRTRHTDFISRIYSYDDAPERKECPFLRISQQPILDA